MGFNSGFKGLILNPLKTSSTNSQPNCLLIAHPNLNPWLNKSEITPSTTWTLCHHHHHVHEGLGVFPVPWSSKWNRSLHLFLGRSMFLRPFDLYCNACFGILFVSILCTCCSQFSRYRKTHKSWEKPTATTTAALSANPTPTSTKAKAAWPLVNAAETAADGRRCRRKVQRLKTGTIQLREHTPTEKHAGLEASRWQPHH